MEKCVQRLADEKLDHLEIQRRNKELVEEVQMTKLLYEEKCK